MNPQKMQRWKRIALALACTSAFVVEAADKFCWEENFRNYSDHAPGIVMVPGIGIGNDPIWVYSAELNVWPQKENIQAFTLYEKDIAVPGLKDLTIAFSYRILNADMPVEAKPEVKDKNGKVTKAAVAAVPGKARKFNVLVNETVVTIASDSVTVDGKTASTPFLQNWKWEEAAIRIKDNKLTVYLSTDRKLNPVLEVPFESAVNKVNFSGTNDHGFSISNIKIEQEGQLRDFSAAKWFADFRSLTQPLDGSTKADISVPVDSKAGRAGVRLVMNSPEKALNLNLVWDNGFVETYPITVSDTSDDLTVPMFNKGKHQVKLPDAVIRIGARTTQFVRPLMRRFRSSYDAVDQYIDIIRDWEQLPAATQHPLDIDFVCQADGSVQMLLDGSYVWSRSAVRADAEAEKKANADLKAATDALKK